MLEFVLDKFQAKGLWGIIIQRAEPYAFEFARSEFIITGRYRGA